MIWLGLIVTAQGRRCFGGRLSRLFVLRRGRGVGRGLLRRGFRVRWIGICSSAFLRLSQGLLHFSAGRGLVAGGVDGGDAVGVGVAGFGGLVTEGWADDWGLGQAYEFLRREFSPVGMVADEIGVGAGLPGEVDGVGGGDGGEAGGGLWGEDVCDLKGYWRRDRATQVEGVAIEGDGADALRGVGVDLAFEGGSVKGAACVGVVFGGEPDFSGGVSAELERRF